MCQLCAPSKTSRGVGGVVRDGNRRDFGGGLEIRVGCRGKFAGAMPCCFKIGRTRRYEVRGGGRETGYFGQYGQNANEDCLPGVEKEIYVGRDFCFILLFLCG